MRMRRKKNLIPRLEKCAPVAQTEPQELKGRWLATYPGHDELRAEIGCGKGRFTAETAKSAPNALYIAVEKDQNAMVMAMERVMAENIANVRFLDMDAQGLRDIFAPEELDVIYINFPDPWPRAREAKHRLTSPQFLPIYRELLKPGGRIEFKTDQAPLFDWSLDQLETEGFLLREVCSDLHANGPVGIMTNYEEKFYAQGVKICRCVAVKPQA